MKSAFRCMLAWAGALVLVTGCGTSEAHDSRASGGSAGQGGAGQAGGGRAGSNQAGGGQVSGGSSNPNNCTGPANEFPGQADQSFESAGVASLLAQSTGGASPTLSDIRLLADGKITGVGYDSMGCFAFLLNTDGSPDDAFGSSGVTRFGTRGAFCNSLTVDSTGRLLVSGNHLASTSTWDAALFRITNDGALDTTFGAEGVAVADLGSNNDRSWATLVRSDGSSVSLAMRDANGATPGTLLLFYDAGGQPMGDNVELDAGAGRNIPSAIADLGDALLVAGFNQTDGLAFFAKVDNAGALVTTFGDGGWTRTEPGTVSGNLLGLHTGAGGTLLAWANGTGQRLVTFDELGRPGPFAAEISGYAKRIAVQCDGKVLAAGLSVDVTPVLERLLPDGSVDTTFGELGTSSWQSSGELTAVLLQPDAKIIVSGWGGGVGPFVARLLP